MSELGIPSGIYYAHGLTLPTDESQITLRELSPDNMKDYAESPRTAYGKVFAHKVNDGPLDLENAFRVHTSVCTQTLDKEVHVVYLVYPDADDEALKHDLEDYQEMVNPPKKEGETVQVFELEW